MRAVIIAVFCFVVYGLSAAVAAEVHPIVEVETGYLFGGTANRKWIGAKEIAKRLPEKTTYRTYSLTTEIEQTTGGRAKSAEEICPQTMTVELRSKPEGGTIAVAAPWNALPRVPRVADTTQKIYLDAVAQFLKGRGIKEPKAKITQILRVDLEGDGEEEVLISATNYFSKDDTPPNFARAGTYSVVLLRRVVDGKIRTQFVAGEIYPKKKDFNAPNEYEVAAILDLDGDGKLEVVVLSEYYEGRETTIFRCTPAKIEKLLSVDCGA